MAEEAIPAEEEWDGVGDNPFGPVPSPEEVREALQRLPRPSKPVNYNTAEAEFWRLRYIPAGSVIQFKDPVAVLDAPADVGVLVLSTLSQPGGVWVTAKFLGASTEASKERLQSYFRKRAARIHICALDKEGVCHEDSSEGFHLSEFTWYPPGDFKADWLSRYATKQVSGGPKLCLEEEKVAERESEEKKKKAPVEDAVKEGLSEVEERLRRLRPSALRVRFAGDKEPCNTPRREGTAPGSATVGAGDLAGPCGSLVPRRDKKAVVKKEVIEIESENEERRQKEKSLGKTLAIAAASQAASSHKKKRKRKRKKSRSRSRAPQKQEEKAQLERGVRQPLIRGGDKQQRVPDATFE